MDLLDEAVTKIICIDEDEATFDFYRNILRDFALAVVRQSQPNGPDAITETLLNARRLLGVEDKK